MALTSEPPGAGRPDPGARLDAATQVLRDEPVPDTSAAVERVVARARRWRTVREVDADTSDLGPRLGRVTVAEHVVAAAVRAAADQPGRVLVTDVDVRRDGARCTGLQLECSAAYGVDLRAAGEEVAVAAAGALADVLGPGAPDRASVDVAVTDVLGA